jgi:hypothetical protein
MIIQCSHLLLSCHTVLSSLAIIRAMLSPNFLSYSSLSYYHWTLSCHVIIPSYYTMFSSNVVTPCYHSMLWYHVIPNGIILDTICNIIPGDNSFHFCYSWKPELLFFDDFKLYFSQLLLKFTFLTKSTLYTLPYKIHTSENYEINKHKHSLGCIQQCSIFILGEVASFVVLFETCEALRIGMVGFPLINMQNRKYPFQTGTRSKSQFYPLCPRHVPLNLFPITQVVLKSLLRFMQRHG